MSPTHGSLCSGYDGIGLALQAEMGAELAWVCDYDAAPSKVLAAHHPHLTNHTDLTALVWAEEPVDLVSAGYPCQPFSGAGKRLGLDDPRHLFPWIAEGIGRMRPPLVLLENVRGHLTLGADTVLTALDRLGYAVRYTLIRAADVGACHGRARWFALAADRDVHTWATPDRRPWGRLDGDTWVDPDDGLFGAHPKLLNDKGSVPLPSGGLLVDGVLWEEPALLGQDLVELLPTPRTGPNRASRGALTGTGPSCDNGGAGQWSAPGLEQALELAQGILPREYEDWSEVRGADALLPTPLASDGGTVRGSSSGYGLRNVSKEIARGDHLLPTPRTTDANGHGAHGDGGLDLRIAVTLLPTPKARDGKGRDPNPRGVDLNEAVALLPTPAAGGSKGTRNSTARRSPGQEHHHTGDTLSDLVFRGDLLPTPRATDGTKGGPNQAGSSGDLMLPSAVMPHNLLCTPTVEDAGREGSAAWSELWAAGEFIPQHEQRLRTQVHALSGSRWGRYAAAVTRHERVLGRAMRPPTAPTGKGGAQRLSPAFVEDMMMLPVGHVTNPALGLKRDAILKLLGNGVVPPQCQVAVRHLLDGLVARRTVAA